MTVNGYLESLANNLILSDIEKNNIKRSIEAIKYRLNNYFQNEVLEVMLFGSYTRGTILPRRYDDKSDIDIMVIFSNSERYNPQTFLNKLKKFAELWYTASEIYQSSPTIVLELNHIKFELVPAYWSIYTNSFHIPSTPSSWMTTAPDTFNSKLSAFNSENKWLIKPSIRLIKLLNIRRNNRAFRSFEIESYITDNLRYTTWACSTRMDYLQYLLDGIKGMYPWTCTTTIQKILNELEDAVELEKHGKMIAAEDKMNKIFRM